MTLAELATQTKLPVEYLAFLRAVSEGVEEDYDSEDERLVVDLGEQLSALQVEEE